jgi:hypothetical protein
VDRLCEGWTTRSGRTYLPVPTAAATVFRHRLTDPMFPLLAQPRTPQEMLDTTAIYTYDSLVP